MVRLLIWCALALLAILFMGSAASSSLKSPDAWAVPNFFGTVALPIARTPYDSKWNHAGIGSGGSAALLDRHRAGRPAFLDLEKVQSDINRRVSYRADSPRLGGGDAWSAAAETLARGSGDCEDFAIAKGRSLLALGFLPQDIYLVLGNYRAMKSAHAILVVRVDGEFWILDNLSRLVVRADQYRDFSPVVTFSADRKWVHGFARAAPRRLAIAGPRAHHVPLGRLAAVKVSQLQF